MPDPIRALLRWGATRSRRRCALQFRATRRNTAFIAKVHLYPCYRSGSNEILANKAAEPDLWKRHSTICANLAALADK